MHLLAIDKESARTNTASQADFRANTVPSAQGIVLGPMPQAGIGRWICVPRCFLCPHPPRAWPGRDRLPSARAILGELGKGGLPASLRISATLRHHPHGTRQNPRYARPPPGKNRRHPPGNVLNRFLFAGLSVAGAPPRASRRRKITAREKGLM